MYRILLVLGMGLTGISCASEKLHCIDKEKIDPDAICTQQYDPVCGCNKITYGNECIAKSNGITAWKKGECPGQ